MSYLLDDAWCTELLSKFNTFQLIGRYESRGGYQPTELPSYTNQVYQVLIHIQYLFITAD